MKVHSDVDLNHPLWQMFQQAGRKLSIEYGVIIRLYFDEDARRMYYMIDDHEFDSVKDLRKALRLRSFL